jgi:hypothetical protein
MNELKNCPTCKTEYELQPEKCGNCGYPFSGTDNEKSHFIAHQILKKGHISDARDSVKNARTILFVIAGFNIVFPFFYFWDVPNNTLSISISVIIGLIFLSFGFLVKKMPFESILIPLILLLFFYIINALIDPMTLFQGIIWKALIVGGLSYSLIRVRKSEKIKKQSKHLAENDCG